MSTRSHKSDTNLNDLGVKQAELDTFFGQLHFEYYEEPTTDSVRNVCWQCRFPAFALPSNSRPGEPTAPFLLMLSVDYELVIGDAPDVPSSANFDCYYNGVRLELRDAKSNESLGTLPLKISTIGELKAFLAKFPRRP